MICLGAKDSHQGFTENSLSRIVAEENQQDSRAATWNRSEGSRAQELTSAARSEESQDDSRAVIGNSTEESQELTSAARSEESQQQSAGNRTEELQQESEEDRLKRLQASLDSINNKIKAKIQVDKATSHRQFTELKHKDPVASLEIPIGMFFHWVDRRKLEIELGMTPSSYVDMLNFSLRKTRLFTSIDQTMEHRMTKTLSKLQNKYKSLKGAKKQELKRFGTYNLLVFKNEALQHNSLPRNLAVLKEANVISIPGS